MGIFDSVKDEYKKQQVKIAEQNDARGSRLDKIAAEYMGGFGEKKKGIGTLTFYEKQTEFKVPLSVKSSFTILNNDISDIALEGKDEVNRRVTVTRLLAVGIFAFALKKKDKDKESYITIVLSDGREAIFFIKDNSPMQLKAKLSKSISHLKQVSHTNRGETTTTNSVADELVKLAKLKEQGIITQAEFDKKKTELLS